MNKYYGMHDLPIFYQSVTVQDDIYTHVPLLRRSLSVESYLLRVNMKQHNKHTQHAYFLSVRHCSAPGGV